MALRFGYCEIPITPDPQMPLEGYLHRGVMGLGGGPVLDDLYVRALALEADGERVLIVSLDLCELDRPLAARLREETARAAGLQTASVLLATTHTHSGPVVNRAWGARDLPEEDSRRGDELIRAYTERLARAVRAAARQSTQTLYAATAEYAQLQYGMSYNRRLVSGGEAHMLYSLWENPGRLPDGPTDDVVPIVAITRSGGEPVDRYAVPSGMDRVVLFAASAHPVVLGQDSRAISADYPGAACRAIERWLGYGTKALFLLGPCGDTQPFLSTQQNPEAVRIVGEALGGAVVARLGSRTPLEPSPLSVWQEEIPYTAGQTITLHGIRVGDLCVVAVSAECFADLGNRLRALHPRVPLIVATNANGTAGYIPSREAFSAGGYEIEQARAAGIPSDMLDRVAERLDAWLRGDGAR